MAEHSGAGGDLCAVYALWDIRLSPAADGLASARRESAASHRQTANHSGSRQRRVAHPAILAAVAGAVAQRYRRDRHSRHGLADAAGDFAGKLLSLDLGWQELNTEQLKRIATMAAGFTGLLSLFNILGRFFWASVSDMCGRKVTFALIFFLGTLLYGTLPLINHGGYVAFLSVRFA